MKMILPLLVCLLPLLAGCSRSSDPAMPEELIGELPSDCRPSSANGWFGGGDERAAAWFATNPFQGRRVEFRAVLMGGQNACSVHTLESHTPGCVTLTVVAQPVTVFGYQFRPFVAGKMAKPSPIGEFTRHTVELHIDPATAERLRIAPFNTPAFVRGTVVRSAAVGFNCPKPAEVDFCLSDISVRLASDAAPATASAAQ